MPFGFGALQGRICGGAPLAAIETPTQGLAARRRVPTALGGRAPAQGRGQRRRAQEPL